jgi:hypothetical protein
MARGCRGRLKKTGRKQLRTEELGETWLRRRKPTKGFFFLNIFIGMLHYISD